MLHDIQVYAISVGLQWEGLVTGGLLVAALTLWERFAIKRQVSLGIAFFVFLAGGFIGSSFLVWSDEHSAKNQLEERLTNGRPNIENVATIQPLAGQPARIIFHVSKKVYHPIIYFIFSGSITNVSFGGTSMNSSQNIISNNVFRIEFTYPELIPGVPYEIVFTADPDVRLLAIVPQFSDPDPSKQ